MTGNPPRRRRRRRGPARVDFFGFGPGGGVAGPVPYPSLRAGGGRRGYGRRHLKLRLWVVKNVASARPSLGLRLRLRLRPAGRGKRA